MPLYRKTAIVHIELPSGATAESLPLTTDRTFGVMLTIEGQSFPASYFHSPIADEQWRDFSRRLSICNTTRDDKQQDLLNRHAIFIRNIGLQLYNALVALSVPLQTFLDKSGTPRRLVIQSTRPELHLLPWGALFDNGGNFLAAGDLSIVQSWNDFSQAVAVTQSKLTVLRVMGEDTPGATIAGLENPPPEIVLIPDRSGSNPDILHVEAHGDAVTHQIDDRSSTSFSASYGQPRIALLWSCFSSAANSWGDSPALCLHRDGASLVLSFQAELHVNDATSISTAFYREVFGAAASRDPETALVHARAFKYQNEFAYANWASMTVYLSSPLDLSALPLNGPRTPSSRWSDLTSTDPVPAPVAIPAVPPPPPDPAIKLWSGVVEKIHNIEPGNWKQMHIPDGIDPSAPLPRSVFGAWRGNLILLDSGPDGSSDPLSSEILHELDLGRLDQPTGDPSERLVWFFDRIAHYGSPLILWINSLPHHMEFLKTIEPDPALSFLLLTRPEPTEETATIPQLVDLNSLAEAGARGTLLLECIDAGIPASDEDLFAAYYASCRVEAPEDAARYLRQVHRVQEWLLLTGNFISRRDRKGVRDTVELLDLGGRFLQPEEEPEDPNGPPAPAGDYVSRDDFESLRRPEDFYRLAMNQPPEQSTLRETARAKHELAYLKQQQGRPGTAELLYRLSLDDLMSCTDNGPGSSRDSRWRYAISSALRDLADLLSGKPERIRDASALLDRAMAIQSFHGMKLQLGYSETTAAKIAHTLGHHTECINLAVSAANRMEDCRNFRGWTEAFGILFDSLAETRETARMIALAKLGTEKVRAANPDSDDHSKEERLFKFEKGRAHWIAGDIDEARAELESLASNADDDEKSQIDRQIDQLLAFIRVTPPAPRPATASKPSAQETPRHAKPPSTQPTVTVP
jgi:hypothetical protein